MLEKNNFIFKNQNIKEFSVFVKKELVDKSMTQKELAQKIGCERVYLNQILNGRVPGWKWREKIIFALKEDEVNGQ